MSSRAASLAAQRQLLATRATLQRLRLGQQAAHMRAAARGPVQMGLLVGLGGIALAALLGARRAWRAPGAPALHPPTGAGVNWPLRLLMLWRLARALRRLLQAVPSTQARNAEPS